MRKANAKVAEVVYLLIYLISCSSRGQNLMAYVSEPYDVVQVIPR